MTAYANEDRGSPLSAREENAQTRSPATSRPVPVSRPTTALRTTNAGTRPDSSRPSPSPTCALPLPAATRDEDNLTLRVPGDGRVQSLQALLSHLTDHSVNAEELSVHTPDLDDVVLALTSRTGTAQKENAR